MNGTNGNGNGGPQQWPSSSRGAPATRTYRREAAPKRLVATGLFLLDATRRRRSGRIVLWSFVGLLALAGVALLAYPVVTDVIANNRQTRLEREFAEISADEWRQTYHDGAKRLGGEGAALTRLKIPRLNVDVIVVEGVSGNALRAGVGHYPATALPGDPTGNVAIAGHRTGFGEPFRHLEALQAGNKIELRTPLGLFVYEVMQTVDGHRNPWITNANDWTVIARTPTPMLTLTTCDPPGTSKNRLIVRARLVETQPTA